MKAMPPTKRFYVGTVNLDRGRFVIADLKAMLSCAASPVPPHTKTCLTQSLLASAAIPLALPPRFIDREMYVDGNVRHGVFATALFGTQDVRTAMKQRNLVPYVSVIVNGNLSARSYRNNPPAVKNGGVAIAIGAVANMVDQVGKDFGLSDRERPDLHVRRQ